jgi:hypothetical protein
MQKWEYLFLDNTFGYSCGYIPVSQNTKRLHFNETVCSEDYCNQLGEKGWELVSAMEREEGKILKMIFKRQKE